MKRRAAALSALVVGALTLTACGSGSDGDAAAAGTPDNVSEITVGALPVADYAPLFYAQEKGMFEAEGLDVTVQPIQGGANAVPALLNGSLSIAVTNWTSYVQALNQEIPVRAVLPAAQGAPGVSGIAAPPGSDITEPADLNGKTIAVNNLRSIAELSARVSLEENGVDVASVKFTELPLPDMPAALAKGSVDAAWLVEPFLSGVTSKGGTVIVDPFAGELEGLPIGGWSTSEEFAQANPETLAKFSRAVTKATAELQDEKTFRAFLPSFSGLPPAVAARLTLPTTQAQLDAAGLDRMAGYMQEFGWIDDGVDVGASLSYLDDNG